MVSQVNTLVALLALSAKLAIATESPNWFDCVVDPHRDGAGCSTAFSPATHLPAMAYTGLDTETKRYGVYYAEIGFDGEDYFWKPLEGPLGSVEKGQETCLAFDPATGQPAIAYRSEYGQIAYVQRAPDGTWMERIVDPAGNNGYNAALAFSPATKQRGIAYHKAWGQDVILDWYDPQRDSDRNPNAGREGWVRDVVGGGVWDVGYPSLDFSQAGVPAISYYDGSWHLSVSMYDSATRVWQSRDVNIGGGRSSIRFPTDSNEPIVASIDYVITENGDVRLSYQAENGAWRTLASGIKANDEFGMGVSLAFDDENQARIVFSTGDVILLCTVRDYVNTAEGDWVSEAVMMHHGLARASMAADGFSIAIAVSSPDGLRLACNQSYLPLVSPRCGDPRHPYPAGDLNHDCIVDFADVAMIANQWLADSRP